MKRTKPEHFPEAPTGPELLDSYENLILEVERTRRFYRTIIRRLTPEEKREWVRYNLSMGEELDRASTLLEYYRAKYTLYQIDGTQADWFHEPREKRL